MLPPRTELRTSPPEIVISVDPIEVLPFSVLKLPAIILFISPPVMLIDTLSAVKEVFSFPNSEAPA